MRELTLAAAILLVARLAPALTVIPIPLEDLVRQSSAIVSVTATDVQARRIEPGGHVETTVGFRINEVVLSDGALAGNAGRVTMRFWGGVVAGVEKFVPGEVLPEKDGRYVLLLKSDWDKTAQPLIAGSRGLFRIVVRNRAELIEDSDGQPVVHGAQNGLVKAFEPGATSRSATRAEFLAWLRQTIQRRGGAAPAPTRAQRSARAAAPAIAAPLSRRRLYVPLGFVRAPIEVRTWPGSVAPWAAAEAAAFNAWNYYANILVPNHASGRCVDDDDTFETCGFLTDDELFRRFNRHWEDRELAVTMSSRIVHTREFVEAHIAVRAGLPWTVDDAGVFDGEAVHGFRQTMLHEIGHLFGLGHEFNLLSTMNYAAESFRGFSLPFMDDTEGMRYIYPAQIQRRPDLAVNLFRAEGYQTFLDATIPSFAQIGGTFEIADYQVENAGTVSVGSPTIDWYLTADRSMNQAVALGSHTYPGPLPRGSAVEPSATRISLTVPATTNPGFYFLAAVARDANGPAYADFPFSNNQAWSRRQIFVGARTTKQ